MDTVLVWTVRLAAIGLAVITACVFAARRWWAFELLTHFRVQYVAAGVVLIALALLLGLTWTALAAATAALPHLIAAKTLFLAPPRPASMNGAASEGPALRLTTLNLYRANRHSDRAVAFLREQNPDILVIQEAEHSWLERLHELAAPYPFAAPAGWRSGGSVLLFSRHPVVHAEPFDIAGPGLDFLRVDLLVDGHRLVLFPVHLESPESPTGAANRNRQLAALAATVRAVDAPVSIVGDFNVSRWSPYLTDLLSAAELENAADGRGWLPTWPTFCPPLGIPIDHVLVNRGILVSDFMRGPAVGSDHWPVSVIMRLVL